VNRRETCVSIGLAALAACELRLGAVADLEALARPELDAVRSQRAGSSQRPDGSTRSCGARESESSPNLSDEDRWRRLIEERSLAPGRPFEVRGKGLELRRRSAS
jgi:hypothetical protein